MYFFVKRFDMLICVFYRFQSIFSHCSISSFRLYFQHNKYFFFQYFEKRRKIQRLC